MAKLVVGTNELLPEVSASSCFYPDAGCSPAAERTVGLGSFGKPKSKRPQRYVDNDLVQQHQIVN